MFLQCPTQEARYEKIIELGRQQRPLDPAYKTNEHLVKGCQSLVYLHSYEKDQHIMYEVESDALISAGLAALLTHVYKWGTCRSGAQMPSFLSR